MTAPVIKYTYFPIVGRSFAPQLALKAAGVPYTFEKVGFEEWGAGANKDQKRFPLLDVPALTVNDQIIADSLPQLVYIGKLTGFWPTDAFQEARAIEILVTLEQIFTGATYSPDDCNFIQTLRMEGEALKKARSGPVTDRCKFYFNRINDIVGDNGFAVGDKPTIIDFTLAGFVGFFKSSADHVDASVVLTPFTKLLKVAANVLANEKFKAIAAEISA